LAKVKDEFPKALVGMDAKEAFAECDKVGYVENIIRSPLIQLNPINKQKSTKKFVDWNRQTAKEEVSENYPKTLGRIWGSFIYWDLHCSSVR
jgi:tRNA nucleotidyltransferase/poly(A) polymerase